MTQLAVEIRGKLTHRHAEMASQVESISSVGDLLMFQFGYLHTYLPMVIYAVANLPERDTVAIANWGMLMDELLRVQLERLSVVTLDSTARDLRRLSDDQNKVAATIRKISVRSTAQLSSLVLRSGRIQRDFLMAATFSPGSIGNVCIQWANFFDCFVKHPFLVEEFLTEELIEIADEQLASARRIAADKSGYYDQDMSGPWSDTLQIPRLKVFAAPKYLIGMKIHWLQAMKGLSVCKAILRKDAAFAEEAIAWSGKLCRVLANKKPSKSDRAWRNVTTGGPTCEFRSIIEPGAACVPVDSQTFAFEGAKSTGFVSLCSAFSLYTNGERFADLPNGERVQVRNHPGAIRMFYKNPVGFVLQNLNAIPAPWESDYYTAVCEEHGRLEKAGRDFHTIGGLNILAFGHPGRDRVSRLIKRAKVEGTWATFAYASLEGFDFLLDAFDKPMDEETRVLILGAILGVVLSRMRGLMDGDNIEHSNEGKSFGENEVLVEPLGLRDSEARLGAFYRELSDGYECLNDAASTWAESSVTDFMAASGKVREILLSGVTPEEVLQALKAEFPEIGSAGESEASA